MKKVGVNKLKVELKILALILLEFIAKYNNFDINSLFS